MTAILSGCATQMPETPKRSLETSKPAIESAVICCSDFNEMDFTKKLKYGENPHFEDSNSTAFTDYCHLAMVDNS